MIRLFFIKNKLKNNKNIIADKKILEKYKEISQKSNEEILQEYKTNKDKGIESK